MKSQKNIIEVGDTVYFLRDARKWEGEVVKINRVTYKINVTSNPLGGCVFPDPYVILVPKEKVAHSDDVCTIACDLIKDPNGMSVRYIYDDSFQSIHKPLKEWGTQPSQLYTIC